MNKDKSYKVSAKRADTGKYWTFGNMKFNQYGNWSMGLKVSDELLALMAANKGRYVNFAFFEDDRDAKPQARIANKPPISPEVDEHDYTDIPF